MKSILYSFAAVLVFVSCERTADIKVPENPPMMAAFSFLEVGEPIVVKLEEVVPVFSQVRRSPGPITGAQVQVIYGTNVFNLVESSQIPGTYEDPSGHKVVAGGHYSLKANKNGFPNIQAACTVPDFNASISRYEYSAAPNPDNSGDSIRRIGFYFKDQPGVNNYYRVAGIAKFPVNAEAEIYFVQKNISDTHKDGQELFSGLGDFYIYRTGAPSNRLSCTFELMVMDQHASEYMRSYDALYYNGENPFGEPVIAYTNIEGGLGVFGAIVEISLR